MLPKREVVAYGLVILALSCCILLTMVVISCNQVREPERWRGSQATLRQIGLAFQAYHDVNKRLPPAVLTDKAGSPLYSWRVLLPLPGAEAGLRPVKFGEP